jgi:predicted transglutaminase-like cysteine proteinase
MLRRTLAVFLTAGLWAHLPVHAQARGGPPGREALRDFSRLSQSAGRLPLDRRAAFVNNTINDRIGYRHDGSADRWQTPTETLSLALGDCEDFAIAKFFVLHACGQPCGCTRLVYTIHTPLDTPGLAVPHIVLAGAGEATDPLVFDNLNPLLVPMSLRTDLQPVLSFDTAGLWRGVSGERVGDAVALLRPWRELLQRWRLQG